MTITLFVIIFVAVVIAIIFFVTPSYNKRRDKFLRGISEKLAADFIPDSVEEPPMVRYQIGNRAYQITVETEKKQKHVPLYSVTTEIDTGEVKLEIMPNALIKGKKEPRILTGDKKFDKKVCLYGSPEGRIVTLSGNPLFKEIAAYFAEKYFDIALREGKLKLQIPFLNYWKLILRDVKEDIAKFAALSDTLSNV